MTKNSTEHIQAPPSEREIFLICGPCSAESPEQLLQTAEQLAPLQPDYFRAGLWKPRTRPFAFEGVGEKGLSWLEKVREKTGMQVVTEVANTRHADAVLKTDIDAVWIGARTSVNPFYVQEIADALSGCDRPVFIKNPINPDPKLWIGAIERLLSADVGNVRAIHRGFSTYGHSKFRNIPHWQIPIEVMGEFPDLEMICDASHICGHPHYLYEISQKALDLNYSGLLIESHISPELAKSDAEQQITPKALNDLLDQLILRRVQPIDPEISDQLEQMRRQIDELDRQVLELYGRRMGISERIGRLKKQHDISILQPDRWAKIVAKALSSGEDQGLSPDFIRSLFKVIHDESIDHQTRIMLYEQDDSP